MFNQPRLLVCTDFSENSDHALKVAARYAARTNGELHVLHVANLSFYHEWFDTESNPEKRKSEFNEFLRLDLMQRLNEQIIRCNVQAKAMIQFDSNPLSGIERTSREIKANIVAIGVRGTYLTRKLVLQSEVPVLVVRKDTPLENFATLVREEEEFRELIGSLRELCYLFSSPLNVISVYPKMPGACFGNALEYSSMITTTLDEVSEDFIQTMKKKIKSAIGEDEGKIVVSSAFDVSGAIIKAMHELGITTAVLKQSQKNRLDRIFDRSISEELLEKFEGNFLFS